MDSAEHLIAKLERLSKRFSSSRAQPKVEVKSRIPKRRESVKPKRPSEKKIREYLDDKFTEFLEERKAKPQKQKRSTSIPSRRTAPTHVEKPAVPQAIKEGARKPVVPKTRGLVSATKTEQKKIHDVAPRQRLSEPVASAAKPKIVAKKAPVRDQKWKCLQSSSSDEEIDRLLNTRKPEPAKKDTSAKALLAQLEISDSSSDDVILEEIRRRNAARKQETEALKRKSPAVKKSPTHEKKEVFKIGDRTYTLDSSSDSEILPPKAAKKTNPVLLGARKINISSSSSDDEILLRALQKRTTTRHTSPKKVESSSSGDVKPSSPIRKSPKKPVMSSSSSDELLAQMTGKSQALSALKKVVISSSSSDDAVVRKESPVKPLTRTISSSSSDDELLRRVLPKRSSPVRVSPKKPPVISSSSSDDELLRRVLPKTSSPVRVSPKKHSVISSSSSDEIDVRRVPKTSSPVHVSPRRTVISSSSSDEIVPRTVPKAASPIRVSPKKASVISSSSSDDLLLGAIGLQPVPRKSPSPVKSKPVNMSSDDEPILPTTKPSPKGYKIQRMMVESHISENSSSDNVRVIAPPKRVMTPKDKRNEVRAALADASSSSSSEEPKNSPVKPGSPLSIGGAMAVSYVPDEGIAEEEKRAIHSTPKAKQPVSVLDRSHELLASGSPNARKSEILRKYGISDSSDSETRKPLEPVHSSSNSDDFRPNDELELKKRLAEVGMGLVSSSDSEKDTQPSVKPSEEKPAKQSSASRRSEILKSLGLSVTSSDLESDSEDLDVEIKIGRPTKQEETSQSKKSQLPGISSSSEDDKINISATLKKEEPQKESREDVLARMNEEHRISGSDEELFSLTQPSPRSSLTPSPMRSRDNTSDSAEQETGDKGNGLQVIDDITPKEILISSLSNSGELRSVVQSLNLQVEEEEEDVEPASGSEADPEKHVSSEESHDEVIMIDANQAVGGGSESSDHEENLPLGQDAIVLVDEKYVKAVPTIRMPTPRPSCQNLLQDEEEENAVASESDGTEEEAPKPAKPMRPIPRPTLSPKLPGLALKPLSKPKPKIPHPPSPGTQVQVPAKVESSCSSSSDNAGDVAEEEVVKENEFAIAPVAVDESKPDDLKAFLEQDVESSGAEEEGDILGLQIKYDESDSADDMKHSGSDIDNDPMTTPKVISSHAVDGEAEKSESVSTDSSSEDLGVEVRNEQASVEEAPMNVQQESSSDEDDLGLGTKVQPELLKENEGQALSDGVEEVIGEDHVEGVHSEEEEEIHLEEEKQILHDEEEANLEQKEAIDEEEKEIPHEQEIHFEEEAIDEEEEIILEKQEAGKGGLHDDIHFEEEEVGAHKEKEIPSDEDIHLEDEVIGEDDVEGVHSEEEEEIHLEQDKEILEETGEKEEIHVPEEKHTHEDEIHLQEPEEDILDLHEEESLHFQEDDNADHENENLEEESYLDLSQPKTIPDLPKSELSDGDELNSDMDDDEVLAKANSILDRLGIALSSESDEEGTLEAAKRITDKMELHSNEEETTLEEVLPGHDGVDLDLSDEEDLDNSHFATKVHSALVEEENVDEVSDEATEDQVLFEGGNASDIVSDEEEPQKSAPEMNHPEYGDVVEDELLRSDDE